MTVICGCICFLLFVNVLWLWVLCSEKCLRILVISVFAFWTSQENKLRDRVREKERGSLSLCLRGEHSVFSVRVVVVCVFVDEPLSPWWGRGADEAERLCVSLWCNASLSSPLTSRGLLSLRAPPHADPLMMLSCDETSPLLFSVVRSWISDTAEKVTDAPGWGLSQMTSLILRVGLRNRFLALPSDC